MCQPRGHRTYARIWPYLIGWQATNQQGLSKYTTTHASGLPMNLYLERHSASLWKTDNLTTQDRELPLKRDQLIIGDNQNMQPIVQGHSPHFGSDKNSNCILTSTSNESFCKLEIDAFLITCNIHHDGRKHPYKRDCLWLMRHQRTGRRETFYVTAH
jgi:hypothetical protein